MTDAKVSGYEAPSNPDQREHSDPEPVTRLMANSANETVFCFQYPGYGEPVLVWRQKQAEPTGEGVTLAAATLDLLTKIDQVNQPATPAAPAEGDHGGAGGGDEDGYDMTGLNGGPTHRDVRNYLNRVGKGELGKTVIASLLSYVDRNEKAEGAKAAEGEQAKLQRKAEASDMWKAEIQYKDIDGKPCSLDMKT
jgi:hypothetical protein